MANMGETFPKVQLLGESVARRIAAGEVIERPASVVRELIDNAIDAQARHIDLYLEEGGIARIRLVDDGVGMSREDMELCWLPHATSKIREVGDLQRIHTLGFRGEALSSVAACSRLEIISYSQNSDNCHRLLVEGGKQRLLEPYRGRKGTVLDVSDLFYSIPARKQFLKRAATESRLCRTSFLEKALPFPELDFKLFMDGQMRLFLPSASYPERVAACYDRDYQAKNLTLLQMEGEDFSLKVVAASPEQRRKDRKHIQIYANRRRIDEYAFVQAVEYGFDQYLPGGAFPSAFVFIEVAPHLVDFNIHPAKREAKFHIKQKIHHVLVELIRHWLQNERFHYSSPLLDQKKQAAAKSVYPGFFGEQENKGSYSAPVSSPILQNEAHRRYQTTPYEDERQLNRPTFDPAGLRQSAPSLRQENTGDRNFRYHGQIFQLFLLVEQEGKLLVLDQHAAHERILFDRYRHKNSSRQELLIPQEIELSESEDRFMRESLPLWESCGFHLSSKETGLWYINAVPDFAHKLNLNLLEIISGCGGSTERLEKELYANAACKSAIKDGEVLDRASAEELIEQALALPEPRCPHGRPIWFELSRDELFQLLGRDVH